MFLASPVDCVPFMGAGVDVNRAWIRGIERDVPGFAVQSDPVQVAQFAVALARQAHTGESRYINIDSDPATWFKLILAGARRRVAGPSLLWGTGPAWAEPGVRYSQVAAWVHHVRNGLVGAPPLVIAAGNPFLVERVGRDTILRALPAASYGTADVGVNPHSVDPGGGEQWWRTTHIAAELSSDEGGAAGLLPRLVEGVANDLDVVVVGGRRLGAELPAEVEESVDAVDVVGFGPAAARWVWELSVRAWLPGCGSPVQGAVRVLADARQESWVYTDCDAHTDGVELATRVVFAPERAGEPGETVATAPLWTRLGDGAWRHRDSGAVVQFTV